MKKSNVELFSMIFLGIGGALAVAGIVIMAVHFNQTNINWTNYGYKALGGLEMACILFAAVVIIIGFLAFISRKRGLITIFCILSFFAALFCLGIAIFCFIATKTRYWKEYLGCNSDYKGMLSAFNSVDIYLQNVDRVLCSEKCPCKYKDYTTTMYTSNSTTSPWYTQWNFTDNGVSRYQDCPKDAKDDVSKKYENKRKEVFNHSFKEKKFQKYYKKIEEKFKCTGFCGLTYKNTDTDSNQKIVKYLFSNLNDKIPEHFGCVHALMDWLRKTLNAFASILLFLFVILLILTILAAMWLCGEEENNEEQQNTDVNPLNTQPDQKPKQKVEPKVEQKVEPKVEPKVEQKVEQKVEPIPQPETPKKSDADNLDLASFVPDKAQREETEMKFNPSMNKQ